MKNLNLNHEGFENNLLKRKEINDYRKGVQYIFRFENGYGASVIKHKFSYGNENDLWELGVLRFDRDYEGSWELCYDTPITGDVEGYLTDEEVRDLLGQIKGL